MGLDVFLLFLCGDNKSIECVTNLGKHQLSSG